jgi:hypothetical protein
MITAEMPTAMHPRLTLSLSLLAAYAMAQAQSEMARMALTRLPERISRIWSAAVCILPIAACANKGCDKTKHVKNAINLINGAEQIKESLEDTLRIRKPLKNRFFR